MQQAIQENAADREAAEKAIKDIVQRYAGERYADKWRVASVVIDVGQGLPNEVLVVLPQSS